MVNRESGIVRACVLLLFLFPIRDSRFPFEGTSMKWFEIILVVLTLGSGFIWLLDKLFLAKRRAARAGLLDSEPAIVDYSRAFFPVLAVVLILRSFVAEPYKIPSSSMMPNLLIGDFILVNKFAYGFRLPITNTKFIPTGEPKRGDVVVFAAARAGPELDQARGGPAGRQDRLPRRYAVHQRQADALHGQGRVHRQGQGR